MSSVNNGFFNFIINNSSVSSNNGLTFVRNEFDIFYNTDQWVDAYYKLLTSK